MEPQLLKIEECARVLRLGRSKTYEMARRGELPVVRIGASLRVPVAALQRWIERLEAEADGHGEGRSA